LLVGISTPFDTSGITLDATGALGVDGHITVATGATYDIGTATNKFRDLYLSGDINVAGASTSGDLTVGGSLSVTTDATVTGDLTVSTDATVAGDLTVSTNATITNDLTVSNDATISGDLTVSTNAVITGDLTVNGTTTTINTETLDVKDKNITLNYGGDTTSADGAGITIEDAVGAGTDATILWDGGNDTFDFSHAIDVTGTITADNNLTIQNSNAYGSIEVGGVSGGFIDIKRPFSDDYDLRLIAEGDGGVINVASGELTIQRAGSAKFATSSSGVDVTGDIAVSGTVDGRDVATDGLKLDGIEASADVTDTANVTDAGALMDSEVTNLDQVKAFDSSDYATAAQGSTADSALQNVVEDTTPQLGGDLDLNGNNITGTGNIDVTGNVTIPTGNKIAFDTDGLTYITEDQDERLRVWVANTEFMRLTNTTTDEMRLLPYGGNLFSGGNLDVTGTVTADGLTLDSGVYKINNTSIGSGSDKWIGSDGGAGVFVNAGTSGNFNVYNNNSVARFGVNGSTGDISFYDDSGNAKLFWDASTEFLGLGSTSPQAKLDIVDTSSDVQMRVYKNDGTKNTRITVTADDSGAKIHYRDADNAGALRFNNNLGEVMRIPADTTRVGIGTSSPSARLDVQQATAGNIVSAEFDNTDYTANNRNAIKIRQQVSSSGSYSAYLGSDKNTGNLFLANDSITANHLVINPSGNVGIGRVSNSVVRLSVAGTDAGASNYAFEATNSSAATRFIVRNDGQSQFFKSDNSASMTVTSGGNVGIGTSSPSGLLNVHSASGDANVFITTGTTNASTTLLFGDSGSSTIGRVQYDHSDNSMRFQTNASEAMRIDSSGNVGIGTSSPSGKLHVKASSGFATGYVQGSNSSSGMYLFDQGVEAGLWKVDLGYLAFGTNNTERMRIDSSGRVGIGSSTGTSAYGTKLFVEDSSAGLAIFHRTGSGGLTISADNDGPILGSLDNADSLRMFTGSAERMRIDSSGMLGLGSTPPTDAHATWSQFFIGEKGSVFSEKLGSGGIYGLWLTDNDYIDADTGNHAYRTTDEASAINLEAGNTIFYRAASGTADAALTWSESMRIDSSGVVKLITANDTAGTEKFLTFGTNSFNRAGIKCTNAATYDGSLEFYTGNSTDFDERARIDKDGNLLVGKTSSDLTTDGFEVRPTGFVGVRTNGDPLYLNRKSTDGAIATFAKDGTTVGSIQSRAGLVSTIILDPRSGSLGTGITGSGANLSPTNGSGTEVDARNDIGTSTYRFKDLHLSGTANVGGAAVLGTDATDVASIGTSGQRVYIKPNGTEIIYNASGNSAGQHVWQTGNAERMRLDSSGNLLVGKTSTTLNTAGTYIAPSGVIVATRDSNEVLALNLTNSDGNIASFYKDGTTVGSIGSQSGAISYIVLDPRSGLKGAALVGGSIDANEGVINPGKADGAIADAAISFGTASSRFKDLYLSGTAYTNALGVGTTSPDVKVDIVDTAADVQLRVYKFDGTNNTRLTLTADDSGAKIHYRDATNGGALRFNNNAGEMARFDASSNLLVGTTAPHPAGNNTAGMSVGTGIGLSVQGANTALTIGVPSAQTYGMAFRFQGALAGRIGIEANNITVADVSDYRLKENVAPLSDALTKIKALKPSSFNFINYPDKTHEGFIAHELQEVIPYAVSGEKDALITEATKDRGTVGEIDPQAVDLRKLVPTLVAAIQELSAQVESLTARIEALES
jgi:hypothetical protein